MSRKSKTSELPPYEILFFSRTNEFLNVYLIKQAGKSEYTKKSYKAGLSSFYDYVTVTLGIPAMQFQFAQCSYQLLLEYSQYLQESKHLKNSTVNARLAAVRAYLEYASDCDATVISIYVTACRVPLLTVPKVQMPVIRTEDLAGFLDSPEHTRIGNRDRFILILLFDSAIRVSELVGITLGDIIMNGGTYSVLIHGKGRKERCITLSEKACRHMKAYLHAYHGESLEISRPLIYTTIHGNLSAMSVRNVERILNKYGALAKQSAPDMPDSVSPHTVRRSRATSMYRDGIPLEQVSALLGHSQIETTRSHYAFPSPEQMKQAVEKGSVKEPEQQAEWAGHVEDIKKKFGL
ncbi:MAG: site-specific integrase [Clostridiales bacterium]|nr:site-specific integrase [Clostridiales bacterium]